VLRSPESEARRRSLRTLTSIVSVRRSQTGNAHGNYVLLNGSVTTFSNILEWKGSKYACSYLEGYLGMITAILSLGETVPEDIDILMNGVKGSDNLIFH